MKILQQFRLTVQSGRETKREPVGGTKRVIDSAAEHLLLNSGITRVNETEISKAKKSIQIFNIWEEEGIKEFKKIKK